MKTATKGYKKALQLIEECRASRSANLDLYGCALTSLPESIFELTWLEGLWLQFNDIKDIRRVQQFSALQYLNLVGNRIEDISILQDLKELRHVYMEHNPVRDISSLLQLPELEYPDLCNTQVKTLFSYFSNTTNFCETI